MKIAEIINDKKGNEKIILFFTDKILNVEIRKIKSAMYYKNHNQWILLNNNETQYKLLKLGFTILCSEKQDIEIQAITIENNIICILANDITRYQILKNFTFFDTKNCIRYNKFDFSKAIKIELFFLDNYYIYIPIGLKEELFKFIPKDSNYNFLEIRKTRKFKFPDDEIKNCLHYLQLYDIQVEAVKKCFQCTNGIIELIGGLGKTEIILALCKLINTKTLILCESIDIARQTYDRGIKAELDIGLVQGDNVDEKRITIATIQSSHKLKQNYEMVLVDEVHNVSEQYNIVLQDKNLLYRFGFSATVFGKDKIKNLIIKQYIGNIIFSVDNKELIDDKKVAKPKFKIITIDKPNLQHIKNWRVIEKLGIIQNNYRNEMIINICKKTTKQILILIKKLEHGEEIKELLESNNIKCIFLQGKDSKEDRKKVLKEFEENNNKFVLIGSTILKEGVSIDAVFNLIYAGGGNSFVDTLQSIFRGTRIKLKDEFNVYDFLDEFNPITLRHSKERIKLYKEKIYDNIEYLGGIK